MLTGLDRDAAERLARRGWRARAVRAGSRVGARHRGPGDRESAGDVPLCGPDAAARALIGTGAAAVESAVQRALDGGLRTADLGGNAGNRAGDRRGTREPRIGAGNNVEPTELIWMNGDFVPWEEAKVHVLTHGLHYGTGVFEGVRCYDNRARAGRVPQRRARRPPAALGRALLHARALHQRADPLGDARARRPQRAALLLHQADHLPRLRADGAEPLDCNVDVTIACWEWATYLGEEGKRNGIRAKVSSWRRISPDSLIPQAKASGSTSTACSRRSSR